MSDEKFLKQSKKQHGEEGGGETSKSDQGVVCYHLGIDELGLVSWMQNLLMCSWYYFSLSRSYVF